MPSLDFESIRGALDNGRNFGNVINTGWHGDAVYEQFSDAEYRRRYEAVYAEMDALGLDALIVGGGPSHWSSGGGMLWLTGHFEWHAMACYLLIPRRGEPALVYSMGGSHIESTRTQAWVEDVRPSRMAHSARSWSRSLARKASSGPGSGILRSIPASWTTCP